MSDTTYIDYLQPAVSAEWLNEINDHVHTDTPVSTRTYVHDSSALGYTPAGTGAVATTVQSKLRESVSVKDFGAVGDGVTDDTAAFSSAAREATSGNAQTLQRPGIPFCDWAVVRVASGTYLLTSVVDTGNREIVWEADADTEIVNPEYLNGRLSRLGSKITDFHHGTHDSAVSSSVTANRNGDELAGVSGFTNPNQLSKGNGRDSVALYLSNRVPSVTYGASAVTSYSSTGVVLATPLTADQMKQMRRGMLMQTRHSPQKYAAYIDSFTASSITVKDGWFLVDGSTSGTPTTPPGTDGIDINVFRKAWAINANTFIDANSYGAAINGVEVGVINTKGEAQSQGGSVEVTGQYVVNIDTGSGFYGDTAYLNSGKWTYGYKSAGGVSHSFYYDGSLSHVGNPLESLLYGRNSSGVSFFQIKPDGVVELGLRGSGAATPVSLDFHSGATDSDYDARILCSGGTGAVNSGTLSYSAAEHVFLGVPRPSADASVNLGRGDRRWLVGYVQELRPGAGTVKWTSGTGTPEGVVTAAVGSLYTRTDGGVGTTLYVKETGTGTTGWAAK